MAAPDQLPKITNPLVTREPSIHGPSDNGERQPGLGRKVKVDWDA